MLNPYFNHTSVVSEQTLVQDLIDEAIQIYGHQVYYIPRVPINVDMFLGEDPLQQFTEVYPIEMFIKSTESFQGQSEFISKFGLHIQDQITFSVSVRRFDVEIGSRAADAATRLVRPREQDLIYIQMSSQNPYLFEIRFVENKEQLFELGKLYTYELRCEMMNFTHETVRTYVPEIDTTAESRTYSIEITMSDTGTGTYAPHETVYQGDDIVTATATAEVLTWNADTHVLTVRNITGTFDEAHPIIGAESFASWTPTETPRRDPALTDPIADNFTLQSDAAGVLFSRGPRAFDE